jgi:riboflavin synthase
VFTGIVETVGRVVERVSRGSLTCFGIEAPEITDGVRVGDSVAVNGACLTVVTVDAQRLAFEAVKETLDRTSLGVLDVGAPVNLERAMRADGRLDGHIVQGHVDGVGIVRAIEREGDDVRFRVGCGAEVAQYLVPKGSVAIDGVSLTVVRAMDDGFDVALIPHTLDVTTLGSRQPGDIVNLEADVLGKYVKKYLERLAPGAGEGGR